MFSNQLFLQFVLFQTIISANRDNFLVVSTTESPSVADHVRVQLELSNIIENKFQQLEERMSRRMEQKQEEMKFHERLIENQETIIKGMAMLQESQTKLEDKLRKMEKNLVEWEKNQEQRLKSFDIFLKTDSEIHSNENSTFREKSLPKDCREVQERGGTELGLYTIQPDPKKEGFQVWCDVETRGGGWIYLMGRSDYSQPFNFSWSEYRKGFGGKLSGYWLGLENLYTLTGNNPRELLIEAVSWNKTKAYAHYKQFAVGNEQEGYAIKVIGDYDGDDDCFSTFLGMKFSTYDREQDFHKSINCAAFLGGGFWYDDCLRSWVFTSTNKDYKMRSTSDSDLKELKIMIR